MKVTEVTLKISGMTCDHCVKTVEKSIKALKGVDRAYVDLASQKAQVAYSPDSLTLDQIKKAITEAGYQVIH
jgi:copper ion binding protein